MNNRTYFKLLKLFKELFFCSPADPFTTTKRTTNNIPLSTISY